MKLSSVRQFLVGSADCGQSSRAENCPHRDKFASFCCSVCSALVSALSVHTINKPDVGKARKDNHATSFSVTITSMRPTKTPYLGIHVSPSRGRRRRRRRPFAPGAPSCSAARRLRLHAHHDKSHAYQAFAAPQKAVQTASSSSLCLAALRVRGAWRRARFQGCATWCCSLGWRRCRGPMPTRGAPARACC
eukprot:6211804-Pleurochrysis_carterae.AAC.1